MKLFISFFLLLCILAPSFAMGKVQVYKKTLKDSDHIIQPLLNGFESLKARLSLIRGAKHSIVLETFIFRIDRSGKLIIHELIKKAKEGVHIRILLDHHLNRNLLGPFYAYELKKYGIEVKYFNKILIQSPYRMQFRDHRKILLVDHKKVILGGRNIGDEYFNLHHEYNFVDRDILLSGKIVSFIEETFNYLWNSKYSFFAKRKKDSLALEDDFEDDYISGALDKLEFEIKRKEAIHFIKDNNEIKVLSKELANYRNSKKSIICKNITFVTDKFFYSMKRGNQVKHDLFQRFLNSKESVTIETPYFINSKYSTRVLNTLINNNIKVDILTNSLKSTDAIYISAGFYPYIKSWLLKGLNIFTYNARSINEEGYYSGVLKMNGRYGTHAKTYVIDHRDTFVSTFNFDPRSSNLNLELGVWCNDNKEFAEVIEKDMTRRKDKSTKLTPSTILQNRLNEASFFKQLSYHFFIFPSKILKPML